MTRKELEQLRYLPREIRQKRRELEKIPTVCDTVTGSRASIPYDQHVISIEGRDEKRARYLEKRIAALERKRDDLERWIDDVEDSEIRQILTLRFRDGLSWQKVAFEIGKHDESYPRKKIEKFIGQSDFSEF